MNEKIFIGKMVRFPVNGFASAKSVDEDGFCVSANEFTYGKIKEINGNIVKVKYCEKFENEYKESVKEVEIKFVSTINVAYNKLVEVMNLKKDEKNGKKVNWNRDDAFLAHNF